MARRKRADAEPAIFDTELADIPADLRWREWMNRIEAVLFAAPKPVGRDALARVIGREASIDLNQNEAMVLVSIAYHQPVTRAGVSEILGREVSRDVIGALRDKNMITAGPRSPTAGAPFTYVTTKGFLEHFGLNTLRDLPDLEAMQDSGLLRGCEGVGIQRMLRHLATDPVGMEATLVADENGTRL